MKSLDQQRKEFETLQKLYDQVISKLDSLKETKDDIFYNINNKSGS